jgi:hypothetical protein
MSNSLTPASLEAYRAYRGNGVKEIRFFRVTGDLIRHCELHRDLQRNLAKVRDYFKSVR